MVVDEGPVDARESFDQSYLDESQLSVGTDGDSGPTINQEILYRGIDTTNKRVHNRNLDEFMDSQLQWVAETLATKKWAEKYNVELRLHMKHNMDGIQEMLHDSNSIQARVDNERIKQENLGKIIV